MTSRKQIEAARKNIKKAQARWKSMSHKARKKAMPSRKYHVHSKKWHDLVKDLMRKNNWTKSHASAIATKVLGPKGFLKKRRY